MTPYILVADFGSQYTRLIVRRLREQHFQSEIVPWQQLEERLKEAPPCGIILSGGPASVCDGDAPHLPLSIYECGLPILGICYGEMLICAQLGGKVRSSHAREYGRSELTIIADSPLTASIWPAGTSGDVWMSHGDEIAELPPGFATIGQTQSAPYAIIADPARQIYGLQFHPEVVHSQSGEALLASFAANIANCPRNWHMAAFKNRAIAQIRAQVGDSQVICALSGGVDSAVAALLVHEAIGSQLTCIMVDHGLLRTGEAENICQLFRQKANITLKLVNAGDRFLAALKPVTDPEEKRKIIGGLFIDVFEEEALRIGDVQFLVQGTLYTDVIESMAPTGAASVTIKSHHNVGGLPARMKLRLIEPLRDLFKDEVRLLGREIGLAEEFINRHPFPGPGLALRCPGEITEEKLAILRHADTLFLDEIRKAGLYDEIWQAFVVLLPVRSVGVMGDGRSYERACVLRAVTASDGMTADIYRFSPDFLQRAATRIVNEVKGINRVLYDITSKPPGTIEWE